MQMKWRKLAVLLAALALLAVGCGGGDAADDEASAEDSASAEDTAAEEDTAEATEEDTEAAGSEESSGEVVVSGSSTVEPITGLVGEAFAGENPGVTVSVDGPGTGDGFELFCSGETDISDASRPISEEEVAACEEAGIEFVELEVAFDGIAVLTSPDNAEVTCLDFTDMYALVGPESQGFTNWSDANELAAEIGAGNAPYPEVPLNITAPGEESGTYDTFVELVLEGVAEERGQEPVTRPDYQASPNDNVIIEGITGSASSFGWVGFSFAEANLETVKAIEVAGEDGACVAPTTDTIADGSYPLSRLLYIYVSTTSADEKPEVASFVDYYLSEEGLTAVADAGYVDLPEEQVAETQARWEARETGSAAAEA